MTHQSQEEIMAFLTAVEEGGTTTLRTSFDFLQDSHSTAEFFEQSANFLDLFEAVGEQRVKTLEDSVETLVTSNRRQSLGLSHCNGTTRTVVATNVSPEPTNTAPATAELDLTHHVTSRWDDKAECSRARCTGAQSLPIKPRRSWSPVMPQRRRSLDRVPEEMLDTIQKKEDCKRSDRRVRFKSTSSSSSSSRSVPAQLFPPRTVYSLTA